MYFYLLLIVNVLCQYSSSKKLLNSNLESGTRITRVTQHSPTSGTVAAEVSGVNPAGVLGSGPEDPTNFFPCSGPHIIWPGLNVHNY